MIMSFSTSILIALFILSCSHVDRSRSDTLMTGAAKGSLTDLDAERFINILKMACVEQVPQIEGATWTADSVSCHKGSTGNHQIVTACRVKSNNRTHVLEDKKDHASTMVTLLEQVGVEKVQQIEGASWTADNISCHIGSPGNSNISTTCTIAGDKQLSGKAADNFIRLMKQACVQKIQQIEGASWFASKIACHFGSVGNSDFSTKCQILANGTTHTLENDRLHATSTINLLEKAGIEKIQHIEGASWITEGAVCHIGSTGNNQINKSCVFQ